jgi:hypothetical protein
MRPRYLGLSLFQKKDRQVLCTCGNNEIPIFGTLSFIKKISKYYVPAVIMRLLCAKKVITRFKVIKALKIPT